MRFEHDDRGRWLLERSLDAAGEPIDRLQSGWSVRRRVYDESGSATTTCHRTDGTEVPCSPG